jgi:hypothetical protein
VTAFINKPYTVINSKLRRSDPTGWKLLKNKTKLQGAAQSPSGSVFALVNAHGTLYRLDLSMNEVTEVAKFDRKHSAEGTRPMAIAMPDDHEIHTFWIEGREMVLKTIKEGKPLDRDFQWPPS